MKTVGSIMKTSIQSVSRESTVQSVIDGFKSKKVGSFLVKRNNEYIGIITKRDVIKKIMGKQDPKTKKVVDVMSSQIFTMDINASIGEACIFMSEKRTKHVVVEKDGEIVGFFSVKDIVPNELIRSSSTNEELLIKVGAYGDELLK